MLTNEILRKYFRCAPGQAPAELAIDVLDSATNAGRAASAPTTISWCDGHARPACPRERRGWHS